MVVSRLCDLLPGVRLLGCRISRARAAGFSASRVYVFTVERFGLEGLDWSFGRRAFGTRSRETGKAKTTGAANCEMV